MAIPRSRCRCMARCRRGRICSTRFSRAMATRARAPTAASPDYHGGFGNAQLGYRHDAASNQLTWGGAGSVVAHPHGVTFGQTVGESFAIVRAPGPPAWRCKTATMCTPTGAAMPWCRPDHLRKNVITLDTESMADDTDVDQQGQTVIPSGGAVVMANYRTRMATGCCLPCAMPGPLPFGASARLVGTERAAMRRAAWCRRRSGVPQRRAAGGTLAVSWVVNNQSQSCTLHFHLPDNPQQSLNTVKTVSGLCQTR